MVLFRVHPLVFGTCTQERNIHWNVLLQLHDIVDFVLSKEIPEDWHAHLEVLVEGFIQAFTDMYPAARTLPNIYYIVHHTRTMVALGLLC